jgi:Flp pilus assembly protein TadD
MPEKSWALGAGLILLTIVAYFPATRGGFVWDDDDYVSKNWTLRSREGFRSIWLQAGATPQYYPLVFSTFWVEYRFWGLKPSGYHWVNILLHGLNAVLLWRLLVVLAVPGAWFAAAIFALHPVHVESVAWITERKNVLSGVLYLSAMLAFFRFSSLKANGQPEAGRWRWYGASLALFLCALFSKTVTCSLPAALLLILWWQRGRVTRRDVLALIPFFLLGAGMALVTVSLEKSHVGAEGREWDLSVVDRCLIAGRALWFYAGKLVWPVNLTFMYPRWEIDGYAWQAYVFPVAAILILGVAWLLRSRIGRGPVVAGLFFAGTLVPALGFFNIYPMRYSFVADHFQYLASVGLIVLGVALVIRISDRMRLSRRSVALVLGGGGLLLLGGLTWRQSRAYADYPTLWKDTLVKNPGCWTAQYNLGRYYLERDSASALDEAEQHLLAALAARPKSVDTLGNLALVYAKRGQTELAIDKLHEALQIDPRHSGTHLNLGRVLMVKGQLAEAIEHFREAVELHPNDSAAHFTLGVALVAQGDLAEASDHLQESVRLNPGSAEGHNELGELHVRAGNLEAATECFERAVALQPGEAHFRWNLGRVLQRRGQTTEADLQFRQAQQLDPLGRSR